MAIGTATRRFDSDSFETAHFTGRHGVRLFARLIRLLAPVLGGLAGVAVAVRGRAGAAALGLDGLLSAELDPADVSAALAGLATVSPAEFEQLAVDLLAQTQVNGQLISPEVFDEHFPDKYGQLFSVLAWVALFNFRSSFGKGGIGGLAALIPKKTAAPTSENLSSPSQTSPQSGG